ncbi:MAG: YqgE/AlgH family protein [Bacteroidota bacterium]
MSYNRDDITQGKVLVADPFLLDPYFKRSVVLLVEHNEGGTLGFVINKALEAQLQEAVSGFLYLDQCLYLGGPVNDNALFYLHRIAEIEGSMLVKDDLFWGGDFEALKDYANTHAVDESEIRFFVGYAGWSPGQLAVEMKENSWIIEDISIEEVMNTSDVKELWRERIKNMSAEYAIWANFPDNPSLN